MTRTKADRGHRDHSPEGATGNDTRPLSGLALACFSGSQPGSCTVEISAYDRAIREHYAGVGADSPELLCREAEITHAFGFSDFGLSIVFSKATEVTCHDGEMVLDPDLKSLVARYGVVVIRNAFLNAPAREQGHRNVFPHLDFHRDRNPSHENKYTLFSRDPFDAIQRVPRRASTLFIDNAVGYLQAFKEGLLSVGEKGRRSRYKIFSNDDASGLFGSVILEQPWSATEGVGEIAIIDNNRILHANFRHEIHTRPYSIGARYLF